MNRNFEEWIAEFEDSIASWKYYTDFEKVYNNVNEIKNELNLLNGLVGSKNIEIDFKSLIKEYPNILKAIPILLAKREDVIIIKDAVKDYYYNFANMNYTIDEYCLFMKNTGIFDLLENHLISSLYDYVTGVEVGMDTNARKNRTGDAMEDLVESFIVNTGFVKNYNYFKEMKSTDINDKWGIDISSVLEKIDQTNNNQTSMATKKFDFVIDYNDTLYLIETNFYASQGSKLSETARSYKMLNMELDSIYNVKFVWITDGKGWHSAARNNLKETFVEMESIYNLKELKEGAFEQLFSHNDFELKATEKNEE